MLKRAKYLFKELVAVILSSTCLLSLIIFLIISNNANAYYKEANDIYDSYRIEIDAEPAYQPTYTHDDFNDKYGY